jgi:hypothetical protein
MSKSTLQSFVCNFTCFRCGKAQQTFFFNEKSTTISHRICANNISLKNSDDCKQMDEKQSQDEPFMQYSDEDAIHDYFNIPTLDVSLWWNSPFEDDVPLDDRFNFCRGKLENFNKIASNRIKQIEKELIYFRHIEDKDINDWLLNCFKRKCWWYEKKLLYITKTSNYNNAFDQIIPDTWTCFGCHKSTYNLTMYEPIYITDKLRVHLHHCEITEILKKCDCISCIYKMDVWNDKMILKYINHQKWQQLSFNQQIIWTINRWLITFTKKEERTLQMLWWDGWDEEWKIGTIKQIVDFQKQIIEVTYHPHKYNDDNNNLKTKLIDQNIRLCIKNWDTNLIILFHKNEINYHPLTINHFSLDMSNQRWGQYMHSKDKWNEITDGKLNLLWKIPILDEKDVSHVVLFREISGFKGLYLWLRDTGFTYFSQSFLKNFIE